MKRKRMLEFGLLVDDRLTVICLRCRLLRKFSNVGTIKRLD